MSRASTRDREPWWVRPDDAREDEYEIAHERLARVIKIILDTQAPQRRAAMVYSSMYGGTGNINGVLAMGTRTLSTAIGPRHESGLSLNVTRSVIDAATAKIASKSRPKLTYVTEGGDYEKQHNAQQLEAGVEGVFYKTNAYQAYTRAFRASCIYGTGPLRIEADQDKRDVCLSRLLPGQLVVDEDSDLYDGEPMSWYCLTPVDKYVLAYQYRDDPYKRDRILAMAEDRESAGSFGFEATGQRVLVYEGWRKPAGKHGNDGEDARFAGRYVKGVESCTLEDKPWDGGRRGRPPIACMRWGELEGRFYGQGLAEQGKGIQSEVNFLIRQIQNGHHLITGRWLVEGNSSVVTAHLQNILSTILRYKGVKPEYIAPAIIAPETYTHLWNLVARYYMLASLNEQAAAAQKPQGLDSGEAQRVYADQQTETLLEKGQRFEDFVMECGQLVVDAAKDLAETGAYEVRAASDDAFETIDWRELDDPDGYECRVSPTASLPGTPSGKINLANDMMKLGVYDTEDLAEIVAIIPDVKQKNALKLASRRLVFKKVGLMLRTGETWAPPPTINLDEAIQLATQMLCLAEEKDVEDAKLQLVRDFIDQCVKQKPPPAPPPQAMAPGAPGMLAPGMAGPAGPGAPQPPAPPTGPVPAAA